MSRYRFLIDPFARLRRVIVVTCAVLLACAVLMSAPPHLFAQDPAIEDVAPDDDPVEEMTEPEEAPEDAAPEDVAPEEEAAPEEAAPEEAAPEEATEEAAPEEATEEAAPEEATEEAAPEEAEEEKPWNVAAPCENYQHPYEADLCQQWRTAQAAEETAAATKRTAGLARLLMLLGALATLLLLLMFIPLFMAARAPRRAARDAGSVAAPSHHGEDSEDAIRAYVDVDKLEFIETPESEGVVKVKVVFRNTGQTPAFKTRSATQVSVRDVADEDLIPTMPLPDRAKNAARPRLGRDATAVDVVECDSTASLADRVMNGDASIVVWGFAEYMDVFDRQRKTVFQYLCNADTLDTGVIFKPMVRGDEER